MPLVVSVRAQELARTPRRGGGRRAARLRRRRLSSRLALLVLAALTAYGAAVALLSPDRTAPPVAAQDAQPADEGPAYVVGLLGSRVQVRARPGVVVLAELSDAAGPKVEGTGYTDPQGRAELRFFGFGDPETDPVVRPGDELAIAALGSPPERIVVPPFRAEVDTERDRVEGEAPPGAALRLLVDPGDGGAALERTVTADADGRFLLDLSGERDLRPGAAQGRALYDPDARWRFTAHFADLRAEATLGAARLRGQASPGTRVGATLQTASGELVEAPVREVVDGADFQLDFALRGPGPEPVPQLVAAGDRITLTLRTPGEGPEGPGRSLTMTLPALEIALDPAEDAAAGRAPAGAALTLLATSPEGETVERAVRAGSDGRFFATFAGDADLAAGWRVRASLAQAPGLRASALSVSPLTVATLGATTIRGLAQPGETLTLTLRSPEGDALREETVRADDRGAYRTQAGFQLQGRGPVAVEAGQRLEVAGPGGDPRVLVLPAISARPDEETDAVEGEAPAGVALRVHVSGEPGLAPSLATSGANGRWRAALGPDYDLARPASGWAAMRRDAFELRAPWAAVSLGLEAAEAMVVGNGVPGTRVRGELLAPDGTVVARAEEDMPDFEGLNVIVIGGGGLGGFGLFFQDVAGSPVPIEPGDRVRVEVAGTWTELAVPPLEAEAFVADDVVTGRTAPGHEVALRIVPRAGAPGAEALVTADAQGGFAWSFGAERPLRYNDEIVLEIRPEGHRLTARARVPGLELDLDRALLQGRASPGAGLVVGLRRGAETLVERRVTADGNGLFAAALLGASGAPLALREGDVVEAIALDEAGEALALRVPELSIDLDAATDEVSGRATPGGRLVLLSTRGAGRYDVGGLSQAWPEIDRGGDWRAELLPRRAVEPGIAFTAQYSLASGHVARRTRYVPLLTVEQGGPNACGVAAPGAQASGLLRGADGKPLAQAEARVRPDSLYQLALRDEEGALAATSEGDHLEARLGDQDIDLLLPRLALGLDWGSGRLEGEAEPGVELALAYPARRCLDNPSEIFFLAFGGLRAGPDGRVEADLPAGLAAPGEGFEVSVAAEGGHRVYRHFWRWQGRAWLGRPLVSGQAGADQAVRATLLSAEGQPRAEAEGRADADGRFSLVPRDAEGAPVTPAPGDLLRLAPAEGDGEAVEMTVEPLSFDWSPGGEVHGRAPAGRALTLELRLADGGVLEVPREADASGAWSFEAAEVPPRAAWDLGAVRGLRATLRGPRGHETLLRTEGFAPPPTPPGGESRLYLPAALRGAALAGGAATRSAPPPLTVPHAASSAGAARPDLRAAPLGTSPLGAATDITAPALPGSRTNRSARRVFLFP